MPWRTDGGQGHPFEIGAPGGFLAHPGTALSRGSFRDGPDFPCGGARLGVRNQTRLWKSSGFQHYKTRNSIRQGCLPWFWCSVMVKMASFERRKHLVEIVAAVGTQQTALEPFWGYLSAVRSQIVVTWRTGAAF
jgi:hypothetical protein